MAARSAITFLPSAVRQLEKLPRPAQRSVVEAIERLANEPRPEGATLLSGTGAERIWRIAIGDYRVLYQVSDARLIVLVVQVADRREVYNPIALKRLLKQIRGAP